ncbi:MAG: hypothetical protein V7746_15185 [Halioglobus sp.]
MKEWFRLSGLSLIKRDFHVYQKVDTAGLARPEVESASEQIGAAISHEEMMREGKTSSPE